MMPREADFWEFIRERENIRLRRLAGWERSRWTNDRIFQTFSFTNVKRHHDRTTVELCRAFYHHKDMNVYEHPSPIALINAALFRYFGTIEAAQVIGWSSEWSHARKVDIAYKVETERARGRKMFTGAYIVPSCGSTAPKSEVVAEIVDGIWRFSDHILDTDTWATATSRLKDRWGVGSFMAKEVLLDYILATGWVPKDWTTWTPVGPGGKRGASIVKYGSKINISETEALDIIRDVYANRAVCWPEDYVDLDLTDIQFQFCEFDKYERVKTGSGKPKALFHPTVDDVTST